MSVRAIFVSTVSHVFDFASFILTDNELQRYGEITILEDTPHDFTEDGVSEFIDIDSLGNLFMDYTKNGHHDTQFKLAENLPAPYLLSSVEVLGGEDLQNPSIRLNSMKGECLMLFHHKNLFVTKFCHEHDDPKKVILSKASYDTLPWKLNVYADFNGDGYIDRVNYDSSSNSVLVAFGKVMDDSKVQLSRNDIKKKSRSNSLF